MERDCANTAACSSAEEGAGFLQLQKGSVKDLQFMDGASLPTLNLAYGELVPEELANVDGETDFAIKSNNLSLMSLPESVLQDIVTHGR